MELISSTKMYLFVFFRMILAILEIYFLEINFRTWHIPLLVTITFSLKIMCWKSKSFLY